MRYFRRPTRPLVIAAAALVAIGISAAAVTADTPPRAQASAKSVTVGDNFFRPKTASIGKGGSVTWKWRGSAPHNVIFKSGKRPPRNCPLQSKGACTRKFARKGSFGYVCTIHSGMDGRIKVN